MSQALPARANLEFLKKLCKEKLRTLRAGGKAAKLADIQLALAREYGFPSWPKLVRHVESQASQAPGALAAFLEAAVSPAHSHREGTLEEARRILAAAPAIAEASIHAAAALGLADIIKQHLAKDPSLAAKPDPHRGWRPLSYLCFSRFLRLAGPRKRKPFHACARLLLDAGADANTAFLNRTDNASESALYGASGVANDPVLTRMLLEAGADVNDGESLYHAAEFLDHECLKLLLDRKPKPELVSYCMCHKMDMEDTDGLFWFLISDADPNFVIDGGVARGLRPLHFAVLRDRSNRTIDLLLRVGANPMLTSADGATPYAYASRLGRTRLAKHLLRKTPEQKLSPKDAFLAACSSGDHITAQRLDKAHPDLLPNLNRQEMACFPAAAGAGNLRAVTLMHQLGFPLETRMEWGTALHHAAWRGRISVVRLLLEYGADANAKNDFGGDALHTAIHGTVHAGHKRGPAILRLLLPRISATNWTQYLDLARKENAQSAIPILESLARSASYDPAIRELPTHRRTHKIASWKPLMDAAFEGDASRIRKLLAQGHDPNVISTTPARYRPLHRAIELKKTQPRGTGHEEAVKTLLEGGADPHLRGGWDRLTALGLAAVGETRFIPILRKAFEPLDIFHAAALSEAERVSTLLATDKSLAKAADASGWTALHYAAASALCEEPATRPKLLAIARQLLNAGADPSATFLFDDKWPLPVLYGCCGRHDFPEMAELLIRAGANPCDNESVYHAADEGHAGALAVIEKLTDPKELAQECSRALATQFHWGRTRGMPWLLAHGANPNTLSESWGNSALHEAVLRGSAEKVINRLLQCGADPTLKNRGGESAIQIARRLRRTTILKLLGSV